MSQCMQTSDSFIKTTFGPRVAVLCSQDAEIISRRNNLSFAELIRPFCSINSEIHVRDPTNQVFVIRDLRITICDVRCSSPDTNTVKQMLSDSISEAASSADGIQVMNISSDSYSISVNASCPWFDAYRETLTATAPQMQHEFINYCTSCLLVVSSLHPNPIEEFAKLSKHQNHLQHSAQSDHSLRWMTPNTLKYYVLLHDNSQADDEKAKKVLNNLQLMYGSHASYLLKINSKVSTDNQHMPDPWSRYLNKKSKRAPESNGIDIGSNLSPSNDLNADPLSAASRVVHPDDQTWMKDLKHNVPAHDNGYGCCLTLADHDNLRNFMFEFASSGLVPHIEKTIRNFHEQIASRKGIHRSLFRATKTFFGGGKAASAPTLKTYGMAGAESPELQVRKIADLYFLCQMFEYAYQHYHAAKKDFSNDQAWLHAAGASEMAALSNFMQTRSQRAYPNHYVESAIDTYSVTCSDDYLSLRCALVSLECLRQRGMYSEAASQLLRLVNESDDLKSAILLEQIAQCFLRTQRPLLRKFAFHLVLAGHRFGKASQRNCALLCYNSALQVYKNSGWRLAEDHINFTIGRQSFNLQQLDVASVSFEQLIKNSQQHPSQQAFFMNEYLHVASRYKDSCAHAKVNHVLPKLHLNETVARDSLLTVDHHKQWKILEDSVKRVMKTPDKPAGKYECVVREELWIDICMENPLKIPLSLTDTSLLLEFVPVEPLPEGDVGWTADPLSEVVLEEETRKIVSFPIKTYCTGRIRVVGVQYKLGIAKNKMTGFTTQSNVSSAELDGRQEFKAEHEILEIKVCGPMPKLEMRFQDFPAKLLSGEIKSTKLILKNSGQICMKNIKVVCDASVMCLVSTNDLPLHVCEKHFLWHRQTAMQGQVYIQTILQNLNAGDETELTATFQGIDAAEQQKVNLLFYYEAPNSDAEMTCRVAKFSSQISTRSSIDFNSSVTWDNSYANALVSVEANNVCKTNPTEFNFQHVLCNSKTWSLRMVTEKIPQLNFQQSIKFNFQSIDNSRSACESGQMRINFTTDDQSTKEDSDFQVACDLVSSNEIVLRDMCDDAQTVAISWNATVNNKLSTGQHYVNLTGLNSESTALAKIGLNETSDLILDSNESLAALHKLVRWDVNYESVHRHDFTKSCLCYLPVLVHIENQYNCELTVTVDGLNSNQSQSNTGPIFLWIGKALSQFNLPPKSVYTVSMTACFTMSGVFNLNTFSVWAVPVHSNNNAPLFPQNCQYPCYVDIHDIHS